MSGICGFAQLSTISGDKKLMCPTHFQYRPVFFSLSNNNHYSTVEKNDKKPFAIVEIKLSLCFVKQYVIEVWGTGGLAPHIRKLDNRGRMTIVTFPPP
jgi:hypothetical protein